jgi:isoquinoline 1-oxidoreductase
MAGVVVHGEDGFVDVAAPSEQAAAAALATTGATWARQRPSDPNDLFGRLQPTAGAGNRGDRSAGSMDAGLAEADVKLQQTYTLRYTAHTVLEPRSAIAEWTDGNLTMWTATQSPFGVRSSLARTFGLPESQVRVIAPDTACGFGGTTPGQAALEAARLAGAAGKSVRAAWSARRR